MSLRQVWQPSPPPPPPPPPSTAATATASPSSPATATAAGTSPTMLGAELNKVEARQGKNLWVTLKTIDGLSDRLATAKRELDANGGAGKEGGGGGKGVAAAASVGVLKELANDCENLKPLESVGSEHKNFHATISKLAKAAEKQFGADVESVRRTPNICEKALHTSIITHLYRTGAFRSAAKFAEDSSASMSPETSAQLVEMHGVLEALKKKNLAPAERWVEKRRTALEGIGSSLDFQLARLRFLCFLQGAGPEKRWEAVVFARKRLAPLIDAHMPEIKELMCSLLWAGRLEESPYQHLLSVDLWGQVRESLVADGSCVSNLSRESILAVAFRAGVSALPTLIKMASVVRGSHQEWNGIAELPLEVPLPSGMRYHSMFTCPITKEPSTPGNPPVLLKCGHAVLRSSARSLDRNGVKFNCPTCRAEQTENEIIELTL